MGYRLNLETIDNALLANSSLSSGGIDANIIQRTDDLIAYNNRVSNAQSLLVLVASIFQHLVYSGTKTTLEDYNPGDKIVISDRAEDYERIMSFIEEVFTVTVFTEQEKTPNYRQTPLDFLTIEYMNPDLIPEAQKHPEEAFYIMTGSQAYNSGLSYEHILATETSNDYAFIVGIRRGEENNDRIRALMKVLYSDEIGDFIVEHFRGLIIPYR